MTIIELQCFHPKKGPALGFPASHSIAFLGSLHDMPLTDTCLIRVPLAWQVLRRDRRDRGEEFSCPAGTLRRLVWTELVVVSDRLPVLHFTRKFCFSSIKLRPDAAGPVGQSCWSEILGTTASHSLACLSRSLSNTNFGFHKTGFPQSPEQDPTVDQRSAPAVCTGHAGGSQTAIAHGRKPGTRPARVPMPHVLRHHTVTKPLSLAEPASSWVIC